MLVNLVIIGLGAFYVYSGIVGLKRGYGTVSLRKNLFFRPQPLSGTPYQIVKASFVVGGMMLVVSSIFDLLDLNIASQIYPWLLIGGFGVLSLPNLVVFIYASWLNRAR